MLVGSALLMLTPVLQYIPKLSLAAIVLIAILKLIKLREALFLWHVKRRDFFVFSSVVLITVFLGVEAALVVGILESWLLLLSSNNRAHTMIVGQAQEGRRRSSGGAAGGSHSRTNTPSDYQIIDIVEQASTSNSNSTSTTSTSTSTTTADVTSTRIAIVKVFHDLSFASAATFHEVITETLDTADPDIIIVDSSSINDVDGSGFYALVDIVTGLKNRGIKIFFAAMPWSSRRVIGKAITFSKRTGWDLRLRIAERRGERGERERDNRGGTKTSNAVYKTDDEEENVSDPCVQFYASTKGALRAARIECMKIAPRTRKQALDGVCSSSNVAYKNFKQPEQ